MDRTQFGHGIGHIRRNTIMLMETSFLFLLFLTISWWGHQHQQPFVLWTGVFAQGFWFQRIYCVGHESSHQKLFPNHTKANDIIGQLFLWLLLVPLPIFRKIHRFHHSCNRKDVKTSALDVYVIPKNATWIHRVLRPPLDTIWRDSFGKSQLVSLGQCFARPSVFAGEPVVCETLLLQSESECRWSC